MSGYGDGGYCTATAANTVGWGCYPSNAASGTSTVTLTNATSIGGYCAIPVGYYRVNYITLDVPPAPPPTPEELERQCLERERREAENKKLREEQEAAVLAAEALLKEHLGEALYRRLHEVGYIELDSRHYEGCKYRVSKDAHQMVEVVDKAGLVVDKLCFTLIGDGYGCPIGDRILAKKLMLEMAEEDVVKTAGHFRPHGYVDGVRVGN